MSMIDYSNVLFEPDGRIRHVENWRVYALFCMRDQTTALVKIGISSIIYERMLQLLPGLPYPITEVHHIAVGDRQAAATFEAAIHRAFKGNNTRGEWFEFDTSDPDDKKLFNAAFAVTWKTHMPHYAGLMKWERITGAQIRAYQTARIEEKKQRRDARRKSWSG